MISSISPLTSGDAIAILAPSGLSDPAQADCAVKTAGAMNLVPIVYPSCRKYPSFSSLDDSMFADELNHAFFDASIRAIWVVGGAARAFRLMRLLRFRTTSMHPKLFCAPLSAAPLHQAYNQLSGLTTLLTPDLGIVSWDEMDLQTQSCLKDALFAVHWGMRYDMQTIAFSTVAKGVCEGQLFAGTLESLCASLGTPYTADLKDCVLLLDSYESSLDSIDRMFVQLKHAGAFGVCAGIILGSFSERFAEVRTIVAARLLDEGKPILAGAIPNGTSDGFVLPLGKTARLDATKREVTIAAENEK